MSMIRWQDVFRSRDFTLFWSAAIFSNSAQWMQQIAVPYLMFQLTESNTWVGAAAFSALMPALLMNPVAGVIADRSDRRLILIATSSSQATTAALFAVLWLAGALSPWTIVILSITHGFAAGIQIAAWQSFIPLLVPQQYLLTAVRLNSAQFTASRALGPLVGAGILSFIGVGAVFIINSATSAVLISVLLFLQPRTTTQLSTGHVMKIFKAGVKYVSARRPLIHAVCVGFTISFLGQALVLVAAGLANQDYGVGETGYAGFVTAAGVGSILSSFWLIARGELVRRSSTVLSSFPIYAAGLFLAAATTNYIVGLSGFLLMGVAHVSIAISVNTAVQIQVAEEVRGRVLSIYLMSIFGGIPLGSFLWGRLGDIIGMRPVFFICAALMGSFLLIATLILGRLRLIDSNEDYLAS